MFSPDLLAGKRILVTGGGTGLGAAMGRRFADLAAFLVSDGARYINGEMVTIDGGAHLRSSGAEDLLTWGDQQWDALRAPASKR